MPATPQPRARKSKNNSDTHSAEILLNGFLGTVSDIIYFKDRNCRFIAVSRAKAARHGMNDPIHLVGKSDSDLFPAADAKKMKLDEMRIIKSGKPMMGKLEKLQWPDGHESWVITSKLPLRNVKGAVIGTLGITRDVTASKKVSDALKDARRKLARSSEDAIKAELASNVLHDVNNAISAADASASILVNELEKLESANGSQGKDFLLKIGNILKESIGHMTSLIRAQQGYAAIGQQLEPIDPSELADDALRITVSQLGRSQIEVVRDYEPTPRVMANKRACLQILVNLFLNARDALDAGDGSAKKLKIEIKRSDGGWVRISVTDNGVGIPAKNMAHLFSRGFTTRKDGHGFGLHSSRREAEAMGGWLSASSDGAGKGATFTLLLHEARELA